MDVPFPFGFPWPTAFYLTLYIATLVLHVVFMNYVLAGSAYLAAIAIGCNGDRERERSDRLAVLLRDWMPFMLSAAITAGVAPLLFIQILYQREFYTANLLLFHRWMAILPVLIVGFYLLYLLKSRTVADASFAWRIGVGCGAFACFAFTAWSWTENHLLSLDESVWPAQYASGRLFYVRAELFPRLALWFTGAFPTMGTIVAWQLWYAGRREAVGVRLMNGRCARIALAGLIAAALSAVWYAISLSRDVRSLLCGPIGCWFLLLAIAGWTIQVIVWIRSRNEPVLTSVQLAAISIGGLLTIAGMSVLREVRRLAAIDVTRLYDLHADAATVGGLVAFLFFAALNGGLIVWCVVTVRRGLRA